MKITVVIPAYNASRFIVNTLDRALYQRRRPDEIVVVDDGSSDDTSTLVKEWGSTHFASLNLVRQDNAGASAARNCGVQIASGELIATIDADDMVKPNHLEVLERGFLLFPELVLCFADSAVQFRDGTVLKSCLDGSDLLKLESDDVEGLKVIQGSAYSGIVAGNRIPTSGTLYKKSIATDAGLYDCEMRQCNDRDFLLRLSRKGRFGYFHDVVSTHLRHETNLTHERHRLTNLEYKMRVLKKMLADRQCMGLSNFEIQKTKSAFAVTNREYLYYCADCGVRKYFAACVSALGNGNFSALNLRNLIRSLRSF